MYSAPTIPQYTIVFVTPSPQATIGFETERMLSPSRDGDVSNTNLARHHT